MDQATFSGVRGNVLRSDGTFRHETIMWDGDGVISGACASVGEVLDAGEALVLPGIVDLHGDAFERQLMPRPGVRFPPGMALVETDRQLIANGITTAFHGVTFSWEPGLRGRESANEILDAIDSLGDALQCDTRIHLRMETFNLDGAQTAKQWITEHKVHLLAFNDHFDLVARHVGDRAKMNEYVERSGVPYETLCDMMSALDARRETVPDMVRSLAGTARQEGLSMASHDDETPQTRHYYNELGCQLCEFPVDARTARAARDLDNPIILGAPNVVRGGSHARRLAAKDAAAQDLCDILVSDYYYPSLAAAPFFFEKHGVTSLARAWDMVSTRPAVATGLVDRGTLSPGKRADAIVVQRREDFGPKIVATFVAGKAAYLSPLERSRT